MPVSQNYTIIFDLSIDRWSSEHHVLLCCAESRYSGCLVKDGGRPGNLRQRLIHRLSLGVIAAMLMLVSTTMTLPLTPCREKDTDIS